MSPWTRLRVAAIALVAGAAAQAQTPPATAASGPPPVPPGMAVIADSAVGGASGRAFVWGVPGGAGTSEAIFFVVERIDGVPVPNSLAESRKASLGQRGRMVVVPMERAVKPGSVQLWLRATVAMGALFDELTKAGRVFSAEGSIDVTLKAGVRYRVNGVVDSYRREVWLEEAESGQVVGKKIVQTPAPEALAEMAGADRYTCCNIRYDDRWISDGNFLAKPFIPAGARVKVRDWGRNRVNVLIDGRPVSAGPDYGFEGLTREQFADRLFVRDDPRPRIASWPAEVQAAVAAGKVMTGMTKEQVVASIGHPRADRMRDAQGRNWVYMATRDDDDFDLDFDPEGRVVAINASTRVKRLVVHDGGGR